MNKTFCSNAEIHDVYKIVIVATIAIIQSLQNKWLVSVRRRLSVVSN